MKAALYARCSTRKQDLDSQIAMLERWAKTQGYESRLYQDAAISGRKDERHGINTLMDAARTGEFELVAVTELSRIGRSLGFTHKIIEDLSKLKIKVVLANSNSTIDYNTIEGRAVIGGLALAADLEWMLIQERNARGRAKIIENHIKVGAKQKNISMAAILSLRDKGLSIRQIAKEFSVSPATIFRRIKTGHKCDIAQSTQKLDTTETKPYSSETVFHSPQK